MKKENYSVLIYGRMGRLLTKVLFTAVPAPELKREDFPPTVPSAKRVSDEGNVVEPIKEIPPLVPQKKGGTSSGLSSVFAAVAVTRVVHRFKDIVTKRKIPIISGAAPLPINLFAGRGVNASEESSGGASSQVSRNQVFSPSPESLSTSTQVIALSLNKVAEGAAAAEVVSGVEPPTICETSVNSPDISAKSSSPPPVPARCAAALPAFVPKKPGETETKKEAPPLRPLRKKKDDGEDKSVAFALPVTQKGLAFSGVESTMQGGDQDNVMPPSFTLP